MSVCVYHFNFRYNKKRSVAQVYAPIYHAQEPIVLFNDKVLLSLPHPTKLSPEKFAIPAPLLF